MRVFALRNRAERIVGCKASLLAWHGGLRRVLLRAHGLEVEVRQERHNRPSAPVIILGLASMPYLTEAKACRLVTLIEIAQDICLDWSTHSHPWERLDIKRATVVAGHFLYRSELLHPAPPPKGA
jgi:hypothetical protein